MNLCTSNGCHKKTSPDATPWLRLQLQPPPAYRALPYRAKRFVEILGLLQEPDRYVMLRVVKEYRKGFNRVTVDKEKNSVNLFKMMGMTKSLAVNLYPKALYEQGAPLSKAFGWEVSCLLEGSALNQGAQEVSVQGQDLLKVPRQQDYSIGSDCGRVLGHDRVLCLHKGAVSLLEFCADNEGQIGAVSLKKDLSVQRNGALLNDDNSNCLY
eukprot:5788259-Amphidinium_carterae.1